jgi:5,10-methylenetetrahydromethanopterin reductase
VIHTCDTPSTGEALPVLPAALAPRMLQLAGHLAEGTITWMAGVNTLATHVVPRLQAAAREVGRPAPRVCVGLPIAVTDDVAGAREAAGRLFERYGQLTNYRRLLDLEDAQGPADVAVIGHEGDVTRQLQALARAGATDFLAAIFPVGADAAGSRARTWELLRSLQETALTFEPSPAVVSAPTPRPAGPRRVHTGSRLA